MSGLLSQKDEVTIKLFTGANWLFNGQVSPFARTATGALLDNADLLVRSAFGVLSRVLVGYVRGGPIGTDYRSG